MRQLTDGAAVRAERSARSFGATVRVTCQLLNAISLTFNQASPLSQLKVQIIPNRQRCIKNNGSFHSNVSMYLQFLSVPKV